jgi:hypothetical protein
MTPHGFSPDAYHCLLDEQPYYLVPPRLYGEDPDEPLIVNPDCWFSWHGPLPPDKALRLTAAGSLHPGDWQVWLTDAGSGAIWPFWVGPEYLGYLWDAVPGEAIPSALPGHAQWVLTRANILVSPGYPKRRRWQWHETVRASAESFAQRGYATLSGLIPPFQLGALRRYYRYQIRTGSFLFGDDQVARRHFAHNEAVARYFHAQLANAVSDVARTVVKPSYAYLAAYESGATLDRHTDREQCEYSITICIDATPEPDEQAPWPVYLGVYDGTMAVWQYLGDALLYRGRQLPHHRDELPYGQSSTSLLLHYVDESFDGPLD